jgi:hypothetical protein
VTLIALDEGDRLSGLQRIADADDGADSEDTAGDRQE